MPTAKERTAGKLSDTRAGLGGPLVLACLRSDSVNNSDQKRNDSNSEEVLSRNEVRSVEHNLKAESDSSPEISPVVDREDQSRSETSEKKADSCDSQRIRGDSGCDVQDYEGLIELFGVENSYRRDAELGSDKEVSFVADQDVQPRSGTGETENDLCGSQKAQSDLDEDESKTSVQVFSLGKNRYTTGDEGLLLEVRLNDKSMVLLIDTGSKVSVLKRESFENLSEATIDAAQVKLRAVNGGCFPVDGKTMVCLDVTGKETSSMERFLIADISKSFDVDGILGLDILKPHKVQVDLEKGRLKYDGMWIPCVGSEGEEYVCTLSADVIVEPRCAALLKASLGSYGSLGDTQMVEPFQNVLSEEGVLSCCSLQRIDGLVKIPVVNAGGTPVLLKAGQRIGKIRPVEVKPERNIAQLSSNRYSSCDQLPERLGRILENCSEELTQEQLKELTSVMIKYQDTFAKDDDDLGRTNMVQHTIDTGTARPIKQGPRRLPMLKREAEQIEVERMLGQGVISPSSSPWSSPTVLVTKKDGKTRFCVDFREVNKVTVKDAYPLPRIEDCIDNLEGAEWFCTLDLQSGFWQVEVDPRDRQKTAFATRSGLYEFNVLPFGLTNSPATFERLMETALRGLQWSECLVYLDDIIVFGRTFEETLNRLTHVFDRIRAAGLKFKPSKCQLFHRAVDFLGHVISKEGVKTQPSKIEAVVNWERPKSKREVKSFLGLTGYYRRFVKDYSKLARPLNKLTGEGVPYIWDENCEDAFQKLKIALTTAPVLGYPRPHGQMVLDTDASGEALGAVLSQIQDGKEVVLAYLSKSLDQAERNYCITRKELLAVVESCKAWHPYIFGRPVIVRTDNSAVAWAKRMKIPSGQMARWLQRLGTYDLTEVHRPGRVHWNADALSRKPASSCGQCGRDQGPCDGTPKRLGTPPVTKEELPSCKRVCAITRSQSSLNENEHCEVPTIPVTIGSDCEGMSPSELHEEQTRDPDISLIMKAKLLGEPKPVWEQVSPQSTALKSLWAQFDRLGMKGDVLCRKWVGSGDLPDRWQIIMPRTRKRAVLQQMHDAPLGGHLGTEKTLRKIQDCFYWVNMKEDVINYCLACDLCTSRKTPGKQRNAPMKEFLVGSPMERVSIDIMSLERSTSGKKYVLVITDSFTKWTEAYAMSNMEARTVAKLVVNEWICRYGAPSIIHSDQGRQFESAVFQEMCSLLGVYKTRTTALRPQANGQVERFNKTLGALLSINCENDPQNWDKYLPFVVAAYRAAVHESTGMTPNKLMFGHEVAMPLHLVTGNPNNEENQVYASDYVVELNERFREAFDMARLCLKKAVLRRKKYYDVGASEVTLNVGEPVWLYDPTKHEGMCRKLARCWKKGFIVTAKIDDVRYEVKDGPKANPRVVHVDRLLPYRGNHISQWQRKLPVPVDVT